MSTVLSSSVVDVVTETFPHEIKKLPLFLPDAKTKMCGLVLENDLKTPIINQSVTESYEPHQTKDVILLVEAMSHAFKGDIECRCHWNAGHYVSVQPTKEERKSIFGTSDNIWPRIMVHAGYGGKSFRATMGFYRDACMNMSMIRSIKSASVAIRHTSSLRDNMDLLIADFQSLKESWKEVCDKIVTMEETKIKLDDFLQAMYPTPEKRKGGVEKKRKSIKERIKKERGRTGRNPLPVFDAIVSAWEAYNGVQGFCQWDKTRKGEHNKFSRMLKALEDTDVAKAERFCLNPETIQEALAV
jgi:hypothetical protein